jgi:monoamine oxidase
VDTKKESEAPLSFWGTAQQEIIRILFQAVPLAEGALIVISSFWGAYYHGDSPGPQSSSCRYVLCRIPKKFGQFGFPSWNLVPWRADENAGGGKHAWSPNDREDLGLSYEDIKARARRNGLRAERR